METNVLATPQMLQQGQMIQCDENTMRQSSISEAVHLTRGDWIVVYERNPRTENQARDVIKAF